MKRYIDADALYASIAKDTYMLRDRINSRDYGMYLIGIREKIDEAPTADVVEVVRCKDCKKANTDECPISYWDDDWGKWRISYAGDNWFCADGERRE